MREACNGGGRLCCASWICALRCTEGTVVISRWSAARWSA